MSPRAKRIVFGVLVLVVGSLVVAPVFFERLPKDFVFVAALCEVALVIVSGGIVLTAPPRQMVFAEPPAVPAVPIGTSSAYRGVIAPPAESATKASAKRITLGVLAALAFTAAAVPFALHLPSWIEIELVIGSWWVTWSIVLAVIAYRGAHVVDDHRPGASGKAVALDEAAPAKPKWSWLLEGLSDPEGCLIALVVLAVVGIAMLGAWLVVELAAPAVFIVAYRCVVRALAKARAANARGDAPRAALTGMGWAALYTAPLAGLVALVHALFA